MSYWFYEVVVLLILVYFILVKCWVFVKLVKLVFNDDVIEVLIFM